MLSSNMPHAPAKSVGDMKHPNFLPNTRLLLERIRGAINDTIDPILDRCVTYTYKKAGEVSGKVKKIF